MHKIIDYKEYTLKEDFSKERYPKACIFTNSILYAFNPLVNIAIITKNLMSRRKLEVYKVHKLKKDNDTNWNKRHIKK